MPDQDKHYFFTVLLTDQYLQSALVVNNGQGIQIKEFSTLKTYLDRKDLLEQLDQSLQQLGTESQDVVETIFVFDHSWLEDAS
jgi:aryl-alcohol dehydrogenase-like predicted oxidoreductase